MPKAPPRPTQLTVLDGPPVAQAVSIALAVMRAARVRSWSDMDALPPDIAISSDESTLLSQHADVLACLRLTEKWASAASVAVCPDCGRWILAGRTPIGQRCRMTAGCTGKPHKVAPARKAKPDANKPSDGEAGAEAGDVEVVV